MKRSLRTLAAVLALAFTGVALPSPAVAAPEATPLASLVDDSFAVPADVQLLAGEPVYDEPAVPSGMSSPDAATTVMWVMLAAVGGFLAGTVLTCFTCWFMFMTLYY